MKRDRTKFWDRLIRQIAIRGGVTYTELKAFDVFDFFVTLTSYEDEVKREIAANKKALAKAKKKKRK